MQTKLTSRPIQLCRQINEDGYKCLTHGYKTFVTKVVYLNFNREKGLSVVEWVALIRFLFGTRHY